ncbi:MAG: hypothetical protein ACR2FM_02330 [Candidatus Saccharimonadales bacterium]
MTINNNDTSHYEGALIEDVNHKFSLILEVVGSLKDLPAKVDRLNNRLMRVESDVQVIKKVVTAHSYQINDYEERMTKIERSSNRK